MIYREKSETYEITSLYTKTHRIKIRNVVNEI